MVQEQRPHFFIYRNADVLVPADFSDEEIIRGVPPERLPPEYREQPSFTVPRLNGLGPVQVISLPEDARDLPAWTSLPIRAAVSRFAGDHISDVSGLLRAYHIMQWREDSRYCGRCGCENADHETEFARCCPRCGRLEFPRISPAVITVITDPQDRILLAHNQKFIPSMYSLVAGFTEAGESLEETVAREIKEEVGLEVRDIRYVASQPWPFPNSLMLGFKAFAPGGDIRPDGIEISDARWFCRDKLPDIPKHGSLSRYLIDRWLDGSI